MAALMSNPSVEMFKFFQKMTVNIKRASATKQVVHLQCNTR